MHSRLIRSGTTTRSGFLRAGLTAACVLLAGTAFAQTSVGVDARVSAQADARAQEDAASRTDRYCLRETGTRIAAVRRADTRAARDRCVASNGRVYSREDLDSTGRVDIADALRALDPSIR
jgi:hypothetical protein